MEPYPLNLPVSPEEFAGRPEVVAWAQNILAPRRHPVTAHAGLFTGPPGAGKSSVMDKVNAILTAALPETLRVHIPLFGEHPQDPLLAIVALEVARKVREEESRGERFRRALGRLKAVNFSLMGAGFGISTREAAGTPQPSAVTAWRDCLDALSEFPRLVISIDDSQNLGPDNLGGLKVMAEAAASIPVTLLVAGTPELNALLELERNRPVGRLFSDSGFELGTFTQEETEQALTLPLVSNGIPGGWSKEATARVHFLSGGFPFLVKCAGKAAFEEGEIVGPGEVDGSLETILRYGRYVLLPLLSEVEDYELRLLSALVSLGKERFTDADFAAVGVGAGEVEKLLKLKVLRRRGKASQQLMAIPLAVFFQMKERGLS